MIETLLGKTPVLAKGAAVHSTAYAGGEVALGENSSVFPCAVVRGDMSAVTLGAFSNVQDCAVLHTDTDIPLIIGDYVTVGHGAILHSAEIGGNTVIGMGAIVLDRAVVGKNCIIGAGTLIPPGKVIPDGSVAVGNPFRILRETSADDIAANRQNALHYVELFRAFRK